MHPLRLFIAALAPATLINGLAPRGNHGLDYGSAPNRTIVSHVHVKRDIPMAARDIEEAVYKHSILKHFDGSDYTVWVHNSFDPNVKDHEKRANDTAALGKRWQRDGPTKHRMPNRFRLANRTDTCEKSDWKVRTDKHSAFSNGADAIVEWTYHNKGAWRLAPEDAFYSTDLLISGTNTGSNMRFSVRKEAGRVVVLGTKDVRDVTNGAIHRFTRKIKGVLRLAGKGKMKCWDESEGENMLWWEFDRSDRDIEP
ncbi:hypothetical protein FVER53590_12245 [Fusarium verticillioides]|nr:hypothetical protein FVER53590_12245 [Fusarium verticillioides]